MTQGTAGPDGSSVTVKVFPRFAAALDFQPIPINLVVTTEPGSELDRSREKSYGEESDADDHGDDREEPRHPAPGGGRTKCDQRQSGDWG